MHHVKVTANANNDIPETLHYIGVERLQIANAVAISIAFAATLARIGHTPLAFKECEELSTKKRIYRRAICKSWKIIYRITRTEIVVLSVFHGSRNPKQIKKLEKIL